MRHALFIQSRYLIISAGAAMLCLSSAHAQNAPSIKTLIDLLGAPTLEVREDATETLTKQDISLESLQSLQVNFASLSAEQRSRLDHVLLERFKQAPRAGLGVQYDPQYRQGVRLASVVENFPAAGVLQAEDIVVKAGNVDLNTFMSQDAWQALRHQILSFQPGETMDVVVLRRGQTLRLRVPLGSYTDLVNAQPLTDQDQAAAWAVRRQRHGVELRNSNRVAAPVVAGAWSPMTPLDRSRYQPNVGVIAGGSPGARPTVTLEEMAQAVRRQATAVRIGVAGDNGRIRPVPPNAQGNVQTNAEAMRIQLLRQVEQIEQSRNRAKQLAADPTLPAPQRSFWAEQLQAAELQLAALAEALRQLEER